MQNNYRLIAAVAALVVSESEVNAQGDTSTRARTPADIGYFAKSRYRNSSAVEKLNDLWTQCLAEESDAPAPENYGLDALFREDITISFVRNHDEMPEGRLKYNHAQGVVGKIAWEDVGGHPYTGILEGGTDLGLIRFSEGNFLLPETTGLTPTLAIKLLRDGIQSVNVLANTSFEPSSSWNFFANDFKTQIPFFSDQCLKDSVEKKFLEQTSRPQSLGNSELSRYKVDGTEIVDQEFPFDLWFVPNSELASQWPEVKPYDGEGNEIFWWEQLKQIPEGTILLEVMAQSHPADPIKYPESTVEHIANIRLTSRLINSIFADKRLFFQHEGMNHDFALEPEWANYIPLINRRPDGSVWGDTPIPEYPTEPVEQKAWVRGQIAEYGCPFAWLFGNTVTPLYDD